MGRPFSEAAPPTRDMDDELSGATAASDDERIIYFTGEVSEGSVSQAIAAMFAMSKRDHKLPIYLVIETYGGSVDSMFSLYDAIKFVPCPVITIAMGKVMSAGVLILASGHKGKRLIAPHARVMTHPAWGHMAGNVFEIKHELKEMERQEEQWLEAMEFESGTPIETLREINERRGDQYLTPQECIDLGIADSLLYQRVETLPEEGIAAPKKKPTKRKAKKAVKKKASKDS